MLQLLDHPELVIKIAPTGVGIHIHQSRSGIALTLIVTISILATKIVARNAHCAIQKIEDIPIKMRLGDIIARRIGEKV